MKLLLRGALAQPATVGSQTINYAIAAVLYLVGAAITEAAKMASTGQLQVNKTLAGWLGFAALFVVPILGIVIAYLRGQPIPDPNPQPAPPSAGN